MAWTDDTIGWCEGHEITADTACPDGDDSCRDHCPHYHAAQDAGTAAAVQDKARGNIRGTPMPYAAAVHYLQARYKAEYDAVVQAYRVEWRNRS